MSAEPLGRYRIGDRVTSKNGHVFHLDGYISKGMVGTVMIVVVENDVSSYVVCWDDRGNKKDKSTWGHYYDEIELESFSGVTMVGDLGVI
jgi:hypothetical protein